MSVKTSVLTIRNINIILLRKKTKGKKYCWKVAVSRAVVFELGTLEFPTYLPI